MNNTDYKEKLDKVSGSTSETISGILGKLKNKPEDDKREVNLIDITKKLTEKKFGKKKK